jgi:hypothetical protein
MLPVKRESHLHYQGRSCKWKYFALHWERQALESSDLESNLVSWFFLGSWFLVLGSWLLAVGFRLRRWKREVPWWGEREAGSLRLRSGQALGGFASRNGMAQLISSDGRGRS